MPPDAEDPSTAPAALLVWRRRDLRDWSSDHLELRHATLEVGAVVPIAAVNADSPGFSRVWLPPGWTAEDRMLFVVH